MTGGVVSRMTTIVKSQFATNSPLAVLTVQ
jgi:hypothetical protein